METLVMQKMKGADPGIIRKSGILAVFFAAALFLVAGCGDQSGSSVKASNPAVQKLAQEPVSGKIGQLYFNTTENREFIFDGTEWVPHDASIDTYVSKRSKITADVLSTNACYNTNGDIICPDDMHLKHAAAMTNCLTCHNLAYSFYVPDSFFKDSSSIAFIKPQTGNNAPVYAHSSNWDATPISENQPGYRAATCTNIACHGINTGTFSYLFPDGDGAPIEKTVTFGGVSSGTALWDPSASVACGSCHANPPRTGVWHSGFHGNSTSLAMNGCQLCHPDASSEFGTNVIIGGTNPMHGNGVINLQAKFKSSCFGCH